ncbi:MAG: NFACT family protein, partial [Oscillospiraceae bacterium]|nr:NFACT family protein [Oscillospiraceae bacterium]
MPLDAICLSALKDELCDKLIGARIDKVQQPERDQIILSLRSGKSGAMRLLLSAGMGDARVHFTAQKFENPQSPPMFCMLLRKHLSGAKILDISQPHLERVLEFSIESSSAFGDKSVMRLIVELIGRMSNIILLDCDGRIVDCLRRVGSALDDKRAVQPGLFYKSPPGQAGKVDPDGTQENRPPVSGGAVDKWILNTFSGFSPLIARELSWRTYGSTDFRFENAEDHGAALQREIAKLLKHEEHKPWLVSDLEGRLIDFSYTKIGQYESACNVECYDSFSELLEFYFSRSAQDNRMRQKSSATLKSMTTLRDRLMRKLALQKTEVLETSKRDYNRECGDIITANLHLM